MTRYRTHLCGQLSSDHADIEVRLSGWVQSLRDHGGVFFLDLRDHTGIVQLVFSSKTECYEVATTLTRESVILVTGLVKLRTDDTVNSALPTGFIEVVVEILEVLSSAAQMPFLVAGDQDVSEAIRLKYRFLDLRRSEMHNRIFLRSKVLSYVRQILSDSGFVEVQTPILTSSSPEGARDYLVPSRLYPGNFYALPQAPQQFKQLLMMGGFDKYFQIAPCFRDEDSRADRSPGEFYQIDIEMAFVEQSDVFSAIEMLLTKLYSEFSTWRVSQSPFPRISYKDAIRKYGTDKPDLRIAFDIHDVTSLFQRSIFRVFRQIVDSGGVVRALCVPNLSSRPRRFFEELDDFVRARGGKGLGYLLFGSARAEGPLAKAIEDSIVAELRKSVGAEEGSVVFLIADEPTIASSLAGNLRLELGERLGYRSDEAFEFCWIVDFPMYQWNDSLGRPEFAHNPFSMPQGGMESLESQEYGDILAYQYDIVCNGLELSSGAIRNHLPEIMYKAFEIAGYSKEAVDREFGGMVRALQYGAPPHGGIAPGFDRIIMQLSNQNNLREVIAFPMNQLAQDLMMGAPSPVSEERLKELHIRVRS